MKRVLYIAFFFPPQGGAGVQRSLKFVRYLPAFGWRATVLTSRARYWMRDETLLAELDPETRIARAPFWGGKLAGGGSAGGTRSSGRIRVLRSLARAALLPDAYLGWSIPAFRLARQELSRSRHDAILTTSSPDSSHLLGRRLKRGTGLPWIADFRDPWTRRLSYAPPSQWHDRAHHALERSCLREADRVIVTTAETRADFLARYPEISGDKIVVIPNGYDEEDFAAAAALLAKGEETAAVPSAPILHAGQINPERPITPFLHGLRLFLEREPSRAEEVRTLFLGAHYDRDLETVRDLGLEGQVRFQAGCPHLHSVAALLRARLLLLLEQDSDRGRLLLPGKVFEYLRAGRPILAVVPLGGAADRLVRESNAGWVADPSRPATVAEGIGCLLDRTAASADGRSVKIPESPGGVGRFERRVLTEELARVLDALPAPKR